VKIEQIKFCIYVLKYNNEKIEFKIHENMSKTLC